MKQECMVGARIPKTLVKALERIERAEETDRSTTVRKLLTRAIQDWNLEHYAALYGDAEVREIMNARVMQGLFYGVLSEELLDLVVEQTLKSGEPPGRDRPPQAGDPLRRNGRPGAASSGRISAGRPDLPVPSPRLHGEDPPGRGGADPPVDRGAEQQGARDERRGRVQVLSQGNWANRVHAVLRDRQEAGRDAARQPPVPGGERAGPGHHAPLRPGQGARDTSHNGDPPLR